MQFHHTVEEWSFVRKGKEAVRAYYYYRSVGGVPISLSDAIWSVGVYRAYHIVCDTGPVQCQTYGYLPSQTVLLLRLGRYSFFTP